MVMLNLQQPHPEKSQAQKQYMKKSWILREKPLDTQKPPMINMAT